MFLGLPLGDAAVLQKIALILNTVLLIAALVIGEILYADAHAKKRAQRRLFYPIIAVMAGVLLFAMYKQASA